ncbi:MAG: hypothetical protein U5K54_05750 [Cytophagales bacterium]|nr:hypothetical protein [Cytophagales bacterium]
MFTLNPCDSSFTTSIDLIIKFGSMIGGLILFIIGLNRYAKAQSWKTNEFVANEMEKFNLDSKVRNAMYLLDWEERYLELFPNRKVEKNRLVKVDRKMLCISLLPDKLMKVKTSKMEFFNRGANHQGYF